MSEGILANKVLIKSGGDGHMYWTVSGLHYISLNHLLVRLKLVK